MKDNVNNIQSWLGKILISTKSFRIHKYLTNTFSKYDEIIKVKSNLEETNNCLRQTHDFLLKYQNLFEQHKHVNTSLKESNAIMPGIEKCIKYTDDAADLYREHQSTIHQAGKLRKLFNSNEQEVRLHQEKETFEKELDIKHRTVLTGLKVAQIFIFVFATYFAVAAAISTLGFFDLNKDLAIPRGLITIVPSSLEQNAQKMAKSQEKSDNNKPEISATPQAIKNTKSVTNSVTSANIKTPSQ